MSFTERGREKGCECTCPFLGQTTLRSPRANLVLEVRVAAGWRRSWHRQLGSGWAAKCLALTTGPAQGEPEQDRLRRDPLLSRLRAGQEGTPSTGWSCLGALREEP